MPIVLIGSGIAWYILSGRDEYGYGQERDGGFRGETGYPGEGYGQLDEGREGARRYAGQHERSGTERVTGMVSGLVSRTGQAARNATQRVSEQTSHLGSRAQGGLERAREGLGHVRREQPLLLGLAGVALGALVGGAFPTAPRERDARRRAGPRARQGGGGRAADRGADSAGRRGEPAGPLRQRRRGAPVIARSQRHGWSPERTASLAAAQSIRPDRVHPGDRLLLGFLGDYDETLVAHAVDHREPPLHVLAGTRSRRDLEEFVDRVSEEPCFMVGIRGTIEMNPETEACVDRNILAQPTMKRCFSSEARTSHPRVRGNRIPRVLDESNVPPVVDTW